MPPKLGESPRIGCPLCQAQPSMLERLKLGSWYCNSCGRVFKLDAGGVVILQERTNKTPARKTDINGKMMSDGD